MLVLLLQTQNCFLESAAAPEEKTRITPALEVLNSHGVQAGSKVPAVKAGPNEFLRSLRMVRQPLWPNSLSSTASFWFVGVMRRGTD